MHRRHSLLLSLALIGACSSSGVRTPSLVEQTAGPLVVRDTDGTLHDLDRTLAEGRSVALVFWQTWCASCLAEAPALVEAARRQGEHVAFFGVVPGPDEAVDDAELRRVVRRLGLPYPQIRDRDLSLTRRFAVEGTPTILILEGNGELVYRGHRAPSDWNALPGASGR